MKCPPKKNKSQVFQYLFTDCIWQIIFSTWITMGQKAPRHLHCLGSPLKRNKDIICLRLADKKELRSIKTQGNLFLEGQKQQESTKLLKCISPLDNSEAMSLTLYISYGFPRSLFKPRGFFCIK